MSLEGYPPTVVGATGAAGATGGTGAGGTGALTTTAKSATYTAVSGDLVLTTNSFTITLPSPTAGRIVGVSVGDARTGAAPVTVTTPSGAIVGPGIAAAVTSILLGALGASVTLMADGTNWRVIAGGQDTGWHVVGASGEPTFANSWIAYGAPFPGPQFRKDPTGRVTISGMMKKASGNWAVETVFTLPAGYRPADQLVFMFTATGTTRGIGRMDITNAGVVSVAAGGPDNPIAWGSLEGMSFFAA